MADEIETTFDIDINSITDFDQIKKLHGTLQKQECLLDEELDTILENHHEIDCKIQSIQKLLPNLSVLTKEASHLSDVIERTSSLAEKVSSKVRELDIAKGRVQEAIKRVDDILDLKSCVDGVQDSLKDEQYETAAIYISRYLSLDERAMREILPVDTEEADLNASFTYLHQAQEKLQNVVKLKFDEAINRRNEGQVARFLKLFPMVGIQDVGLSKFSKYLRSQIAEAADLRIDAALKIPSGDRKSNIIFAETLTKLFENIARMIEDHQPLVDTYYGPGKMLTVLRELQAECDSQAKHIIQEFLTSRKFEKVKEDINRSLKSVPKSQRSTEVKEKFDPKELDILLGEIVLLSARTELYQNFLKKRIQSDLESIPEDERPEADPDKLKDILLSNCGLSRKLQTVMGDYVEMEGYFMKEMLLKAISMDASDEDSLTSSMVDDAFFILQKSLRRTLSTSNLDIMCAVLNNASSIITTNYQSYFKGKVKSLGFLSGSIAEFSGMIQGKLQIQTTPIVDLISSKKEFLMILNNIDTSSEYLKKLIDEIVLHCKQQWKDKESEKLESCIVDLGACGHGFKEILQNGVTQLCSNMILPRLNPLLDGFVSISHNIDEDEYANYESNDPFVQMFIATLDGALVLLKKVLTESNYESTISLACHEIAQRMEKVVLKSSFNRLGGLQFDKELRSLIQYLTSITEWTVRDKFARLSQIATILNLEKVTELMEYWGENSGPLTWRLTPSEVRIVLALRNDFRSEEIQRLKL
ncbi:conserved oligomeric Golgi complex subunit 4-like [Clytia hemisphaerica]|uniref:Conserved oligomeric Golgi complex subunit 4 n=1 Tax=Clytia hemisphaerica TaxID=252671 RepID=A0A7M5UN96_9CNID